MYDYPEEVQFFKSISNPVRLAILEILRGGEQCVCHIEAILRQRQAYISQQLMVLRNAGFLQDRREGLNIYYHVIHPEIYAVLDAARELAGRPAAKLELTPIACTCPNCKEGKSHSVNLPVELQNQR